VRRRAVAADRRVAGELFIEYALLVALFALPVAAACVRLGFPVLRMFRYAQLVLAGPFA
jgi:Flp pilus assembly pilin Flp